MSALGIDWIDLNQRHLTAALAEVRTCLERHAEAGGQSGGGPTTGNEAAPSATIEANPGEPLPALEMVSRIFGLSAFERAILVLCAGIELDSSLAGLCAAAQGNVARPYPTFSLALAAFPKPHWSALNPAASLRRRRLIEVANQPGVPLTTSPLRIDERILHFLTGLQHLDERLAGLLHPVPPADDLAPSHAALARTIASTWRQSGVPFPPFHLCGADEITKRAVAAAACAETGLQLYALGADHIPNDALEVEGLMRLWERESVLSAGALYIDTEAVDANDARGVAQVCRLLERLQGPVILSTIDRWRPSRHRLKRLDVGKPTAKEQLRAWQELLGAANIHLNGHVPNLVAQFNLHLPAIRMAVEQVVDSGEQGDVLVQTLWDAGRVQARARLDDLAQRIEPVAQWDDLVLPPSEKALLREIASHVGHRSTVYESWGFGAVSHRGLGISALFAGSSGTGKTMAAEVLANALHLDLYRIDLSSVVSKYIGETEKNLRRVFDAAEDGGAILFFDEADALFGKRTEVKDSHDRYANIEINYLLQRMESYRGLAVLATNMRSAMDPAFLRRLRFVTIFPFPEFAQRAEIWERVFPPCTPVERLNIPLLARLAIAGGNIRNIAINAAFRAAEEGTPVRMAHLAHATRSEFLKMDKPVPEMEIEGWG
jgi:ATPase family associated with various cellular activities (AAA)